MQYQKPEVSFLSEAALAVKGFDYKYLVLMVDSQDMPYLITLAAYEADE